MVSAVESYHSLQDARVYAEIMLSGHAPNLQELSGKDMIKHQD